MGSAVELKQLATAIGQDKETAKAAVERLMKRYQTGKHGMEILQLEDSYQMCTQSKYYSNLIRIASAPKKQVLSDIVLETLSIIAYRQPVTKLEIEKIRGVKSDHAVNRLVEYNLVYEAGRLDAPGRPALFATTEEFMRRFGIGTLSDLPNMDPEQEDEIRTAVEEELKFKLEELGSSNATEEAQELLEAAVTKEQEQEKE
ncbi:SMC-Scp complex subunit ScpB [Clostridium sp. AM22-11AC]|nr:SMC-Scp complex subunit ScpB [Clostridium sp.]RHO06952.1 SMC-Scp complex subunit ScpB [Clostridium sp. AM22-11AC]RHQ01872.1 SMC-Scp complex subunit ScpB [Clostridium sp. AM51-4]RHT27078.1 SMC-Scp complex subunit ScpB [Clostridium sp. AM32-2]RHU39177.1 SMC-Scp complex subunit ScpB [Clostridium sp. TM06-18]RHV51335.1 SMC-Scp complex subunit ScpB [Clostridium sp. OM04-12AA]